MFDNSFLTHLATGRTIWAGGGFPHADPYTFTAAGEPWAVQSWLASVLYAGIEEVGGLDLLRLQFALLMACIGATAWALTATCTSALGRAIAVGPTLVIGVFGWAHRPYLFGLLGMGVLLLALEARIPAPWLAAAGYVWMNTHGSWPLGVAAVACWWVGSRLDRTATDTVRRSAKWFHLGLLAGALNPYGARLLAFPASALERGDVFRQIKEWRAPEFLRPEELAFLVVLVLGAVGLKRSGRWTDVVPYCVFGAAALVSMRNIAFASLVLVPAAARAVSDLRLPQPTVLLRRAMSAMAIIVGTVSVVRVYSTPSTEFSLYPVAAADWLDANALSPQTARVIAPDFVGNWFEFRYGQTGHVFIDDRYEVIPIDVVEDYRTLLDGGEGWQAALERYDADAVVWRRSAPLAQLLELDTCWVIEHRDDEFVVAVPSSAAARCGS